MPYVPNVTLTPVELFSSTLTGLTLDNFAVDAGHNYITGTDTNSGQVFIGRPANYPNSGTGLMQVAKTEFYAIHDTVTLTTGNIYDHFGLTLTPGTVQYGRDGTIANMAIVDSGGIAWNAQLQFVLQRIDTGTDPLPADLTTLYYCGYFRFGSTLNNLSGTESMQITHLKSGGYNNHYGGCMRYVLYARYNNTLKGVYLRSTFDRGANGTTAGITTEPDLVTPWNNTQVYSNNDDTTKPLRSGQWYKIEYFIHRHETTGCSIVAVDNRVLIYKDNIRTLGEWNTPWGRVVPAIKYTEDTGADDFDVSEFSYWTYPPEGSVLHNECKKYYAQYPARLV